MWKTPDAVSAASRRDGVGLGLPRTVAEDEVGAGGREQLGGRRTDTA
jgi:hypothetical protein